ncbi:MAG: AAA family ATPase [Candidatus Wenzhouxiangella sp. M2_3B_020]
MSDPLIRNLRSADAYPHPVDSVECIETHISWVLLAGDFVYKIKKPLDLGFLDFTELDRRRYYCEEEVRLNRRTAPDLYLGVAPVTGSRERPRIDDDGPAIEYAVRMRRFDTDNAFDRLLDRGALTRDHVADLAGQLARLHDVAAAAEPEGGYGTFDQVADPMHDNFEALEAHARRHGDERLRRLRWWTGKRLEALADLIDERREQGFVRECHGDAHLGNVVLVDGRATLFDCIEFSEELRWIDVANDVAFTIMDLRDRGAPALSWSALDEYLARTGDFDGVRLLPLYMVYRALVRAKVQTFAREQADDEDRRRQLDREIYGYVELAGTIAGDRRPGVIVTRGLSGSGKSWLARRLVERIGMVRLRSDVERKRLHGLAADDTSGSELDDDLYSSEATERTYEHLAGATSRVVDAGLPALVDATCLKAWQRERFRRLAAELDVPFGIVDCRAPTDVLEQRIRDRQRKGEDASEADVEVLHAQIGSGESLSADEKTCAVAVDTRSGEEVDAAVDVVRTWLGGAKGPAQPD